MSSSWSNAKVLLGIASSHGVKKGKQCWNNMGYLERTRSREQKWGLCTVLWQIHVQGHGRNKRTSYIRLQTCKGCHIPTRCNTELSDHLHGSGSVSFPRVWKSLHTHKSWICLYIMMFHRYLVDWQMCVHSTKCIYMSALGGEKKSAFSSAAHLQARSHGQRHTHKHYW